LADFVRPKDSFRFAFGGMKVNDVADALPPDKYPIAQNVRNYQARSIVARPGEHGRFFTNGRPVWGIGSYTVLESDNRPRYLAVDSDFDVFLDTNAMVGSLAGINMGDQPAGFGVSMLSFRPNQSPQPYLYIANGNAYQKFSAPAPTVVQSNVGIAEPQSAPGVVILPPAQIPIISSSPIFVHGGTASVTSVGAGRVNDTCGVVLTDPENAGTAPWSIQVSTTESYQRLMPLTVNGNNGLVQDIFPPLVTALSIQSIFYFSGTTGHCVIVPGNLYGDLNPSSQEASIYVQQVLASLRRGAIIQVGAEFCYVWSSTIGPDGSVCIETSTTGTHNTGDTINSVPTIQITGGGVPTLGQAIVAGDATWTVTTGIGTQSTTLGGFNPFVIGGVSFQPDDYVTFGLQIDHPENLNEFDILFDVGDGSFTENYYYYAIRPSDLAGYLANLQTQLATVQQIEQQAIIDALDPKAVNNQLQSATSAMTAPGVSQWTQIVVPLSSFTRVGSDDSKTLLNINGVQLKVNAAGNLSIATAEMDVFGSFQPDVGDAGAPYIYRIRPRSSITGVRGNPSPATRYGVSPRRTQVLVNLPSIVDPQQDTWDVYRYGGSVTSWRWIGQVSSSVSQFFDNFSDNAANGGDALEFDNFEPWPTIGLPNVGQTVSVTGFTAIISTTDTEILRYLPGTLVQLGGQNTYTLQVRPTHLVSNRYLLQFIENAGAQGIVSYQFNEPVLAHQPSAYLWGPDAAGSVFSCGDAFRPGSFSFTKPYAPDSVPDSYNIELTSPAEPLLGGVVLDGLSFVGSAQRWWALYPQTENLAQRYNPVQQPFPRGIAAPFGVCTDGRSIYWWAKDGIWSSTQGSITDADLSTLFPHEGVAGQNYTYNGTTILAPDYSRAATFRLAYVNGFLYAVYQDSLGNYQCLTCDLRYGRVAWCQDSYLPAATFFYQPSQPPSGEGAVALFEEIMIGVLDGRVGIQQEGQNDLGGPVSASIATFEFDGGDLRADEQWGDLYVDLTPAGATTVIPLSQGTLVNGAVNLAQSTTRLMTPVSIGGAQLLDFLGLRIVWTDDYSTQTVATMLNAWQPSFLPKPETIADRFSDWDDAGSLAAKWWQGFILHADTFNVIKGIQVRDADTLTVHPFTTPVQHNGESELAYSFNTPFIAHMARIEPTDQLAWRFFEVRWVTEPTPEVAETWQTQFSTHGLTGYMHLRQLSLTYAAQAAVTFQATSYDGTSPAAVILPSTGGAVQKIVFPFTFNKGQLYAYKATCSAPMQIYVDKSEVQVGQWARTEGYQNVPLVGGVGGDHAQV